MRKVCRARCPYCGCEDSDVVLTSSVEYLVDNLVISAVRVCDICQKKYEVEGHYDLQYEKAWCIE